MRGNEYQHKFSKTYLFLWIWTGGHQRTKWSWTRQWLFVWPILKTILKKIEHVKKCKSTIKNSCGNAWTSFPHWRSWCEDCSLCCQLNRGSEVVLVTQQGFYLSIPWNHPHQINIAPGRHHKVRLIVLVSPLPLWYLQFLCKQIQLPYFVFAFLCTLFFFWIVLNPLMLVMFFSL